eukprot:7411328-Pyramimonas_sp.AAC.1
MSEPLPPNIVKLFKFSSSSNFGSTWSDFAGVPDLKRVGTDIALPPLSSDVQLRSDLPKVYGQP